MPGSPVVKIPSTLPSKGAQGSISDRGTKIPQPASTAWPKIHFLKKLSRYAKKAKKYDPCRVEKSNSNITRNDR